jgi:hypothetical protein
LGEFEKTPEQKVMAEPKRMAITVQPWPPIDPDEETTRTEFTAAWAKRLDGFKSLAELQKAAGSKGKITERDNGSGNPYASYHWINKPTNGRPDSFILARQYADGSVGVGILTSDVGQIVLNTYGAFICDRCSPPISIKGSDPKW